MLVLKSNLQLDPCAGNGMQMRRVYTKVNKPLISYQKYDMDKLKTERTHNKTTPTQVFIAPGCPKPIFV
jgi:hypothetical protein